MIPGLTKYRSAASAPTIAVASTANAGTQVDEAGFPFNVAAPSGIQAGDLLYAVATCDDTAGTPSLACSGWTLHKSTLFSPDNDNGFLITYYKIATGSEPINFSWNGGAGLQAANVAIMRITGVSSINPFGGVTPTSRNGSASTTCVFPAIMTSASGALLGCCGQGSSYGAAVANLFTAGANYTVVASSASQYAASETNDSESCFACKSNASDLPAGANTPTNGTFNRSRKYGAISVFLKPA